MKWKDLYELFSFFFVAFIILISLRIQDENTHVRHHTFFTFIRESRSHKLIHAVYFFPSLIFHFPGILEKFPLYLTASSSCTILNIHINLQLDLEFIPKFAHALNSSGTS
jgi:hypothetical protein